MIEHKNKIIISEQKIMHVLTILLNNNWLCVILFVITWFSVKG